MIINTKFMFARNCNLPFVVKTQRVIEALFRIIICMKSSSPFLLLDVIREASEKV